MLALRHGESLLVARYRELMPVFKENKNTLTEHEREVFYMTEMLKPEFVDSPLSKEGREECVNAVKTIPADIHEIIYVSPLRRCIETACLILENHPLS